MPYFRWQINIFLDVQLKLTKKKEEGKTFLLALS